MIHKLCWGLGKGIRNSASVISLDARLSPPWAVTREQPHPRDPILIKPQTGMICKQNAGL